MAGRIENLEPWKPGQSGNPGGRPKMKPLTAELERLLGQEAPKGQGRSWATVIAEALLAKASKGDVRAISEIANRLEGRPFQAVELDVSRNMSLVERLQRARQRVSDKGSTTGSI